MIKAAKNQNSKEVSIYGQEVNGSSVAMAKMNMYIHEIRDAKILHNTVCDVDQMENTVKKMLGVQ